MKRPVLTIAKYTFLEAVRNRLVILLLVVLTGIFALGEFAGDLAVTESMTTRAAITAYILRFTAVAVVILYVVSGLLRELHDKTINLIISLPVPRLVYYFGKLFGFFLLVFVIVVFISLPLLLYADPAQLVLWSSSLLFELLIMVAISMFMVFTLESFPVSVLMVASFYLLCRSISTFILISQSPILESNDISQKFITTCLQVLAYALPDLDRYTNTDWLVYNSGSASDLSYAVLQTLIYLVLLTCMSLFDLYRKNF